MSGGGVGLGGLCGDVKSLPSGDPKLVQAIIDQVKAQGTFDELRKELINDVDTKPAYQVSLDC